jgi:hypothetical protein
MLTSANRVSGFGAFVDEAIFDQHDEVFIAISDLKFVCVEKNNENMLYCTC